MTAGEALIKANVGNSEKSFNPENRWAKQRVREAELVYLLLQ